MDLVHKHMNTKPPLPTSDSAFPILAIAVLSIVATAFILVSYYIFVIKCCINWHQLNPFTRRFSTSQAGPNEDSLITYSPMSIYHRGLDESLIREIPTFQFKREGEERSIYKCVVCLNEFQEQDMLRLLPSCSHAFHLDCIDIWLQSNANCPLCRSSITGRTRYPIDQTIAPSSSPEDPQTFSGSLMGSDEDYVVIELMGGEDGQQGRQDLRQVQHSSAPSPRKEKPRKLHVSSKGDECIDIREKDDQFLIQPIRRSFSMDSATDQQIYLCVQAVLREKGLLSEISTDEEFSSRARRSFFPFGHGRGFRNAVFPIEC